MDSSNNSSDSLPGSIPSSEGSHHQSTEENRTSQIATDERPCTSNASEQNIEDLHKPVASLENSAQGIGVSEESPLASTSKETCAEEAFVAGITNTGAQSEQLPQYDDKDKIENVEESGPKSINYSVSQQAEPVHQERNNRNEDEPKSITYCEESHQDPYADKKEVSNDYLSELITSFDELSLGIDSRDYGTANESIYVLSTDHEELIQEHEEYEGGDESTIELSTYSSDLRQEEVTRKITSADYYDDTDQENATIKSDSSDESVPDLIYRPSRPVLIGPKETFGEPAPPLAKCYKDLNQGDVTSACASSSTRESIPELVSYQSSTQIRNVRAEDTVDEFERLLAMPDKDLNQGDVTSASSSSSKSIPELASCQPSPQERDARVKDYVDEPELPSVNSYKELNQKDAAKTSNTFAETIPELVNYRSPRQQRDVKVEDPFDEPVPPLVDCCEDFNRKEAPRAFRNPIVSMSDLVRYQQSRQKRQAEAEKNFNEPVPALVNCHEDLNQRDITKASKSSTKSSSGLVSCQPSRQKRDTGVKGASNESCVQTLNQHNCRKERNTSAELVSVSMSFQLFHQENCPEENESLPERSKGAGCSRQLNQGSDEVYETFDKAITKALTSSKLRTKASDTHEKEISTPECTTYSEPLNEECFRDKEEKYIPGLVGYSESSDEEDFTHAEETFIPNVISYSQISQEVGVIDEEETIMPVLIDYSEALAEERFFDEKAKFFRSLDQQDISSSVDCWLPDFTTQNTTTFDESMVKLITMLDDFNLHEETKQKTVDDKEIQFHQNVAQKPVPPLLSYLDYLKLAQRTTGDSFLQVDVVVAEDESSPELHSPRNVLQELLSELLSYAEYVDLIQNTSRENSLFASSAVAKDESTPGSCNAEDDVQEPVPSLLTYAEYLDLIQSTRKKYSLEVKGAVLEDEAIPGSSNAEDNVQKPLPPLLTYAEYLDLIQRPKKENSLEADGAVLEDESTPGSCNAEDDVQEPVPSLLTYAEYLDLIQSTWKENFFFDESMAKLITMLDHFNLHKENNIKQKSVDDKESQFHQNVVQKPVAPLLSYLDYLKLAQKTMRDNFLQVDSTVAEDESTPELPSPRNVLQKLLPELLSYAEYVDLIQNTSRENFFLAGNAVVKDEAILESSNAKDDVQKPLPPLLTYAEYLDLIQMPRKENSLEADGAVLEDESTPASCNAEDDVQEPVPSLLTYAQYLDLIQSTWKSFDESMVKLIIMLDHFCLPEENNTKQKTVDDKESQFHQNDCTTADEPISEFASVRTVVQKPVPPLLTYAEYLDLIQMPRKENSLEADGAVLEDESTPGSCTAEEDVQEPVPSLLTYAEYLDLIQSTRKEYSLEVKGAVLEDEAIPGSSNAEDNVQKPLPPLLTYAEYLDLIQRPKKENSLEADGAVLEDESTRGSCNAEDDVQEPVPSLLIYAEYLDLIQSTWKENFFFAETMAKLITMLDHFNLHKENNTKQKTVDDKESQFHQNVVQKSVPPLLSYLDYLKLAQKTMRDNFLQVDSTVAEDESTPELPSPRNVLQELLPELLSYAEYVDLIQNTSRENALLADEAFPGSSNAEDDIKKPLPPLLTYAEYLDLIQRPRKENSFQADGAVLEGDSTSGSSNAENDVQEPVPSLLTYAGYLDVIQSTRKENYFFDESMAKLITMLDHFNLHEENNTEQKTVDDKESQFHQNDCTTADNPVPEFARVRNVVQKPVPPLLSYFDYLKLSRRTMRDNFLQVDSTVAQDDSTPELPSPTNVLQEPLPELLSYAEYVDLIQNTSRENSLLADEAIPGSSNAEDDVQKPLPPLLTYAEYLDLIQRPRKGNSLEADGAVLDGDSIPGSSNAENDVQEPVPSLLTYAEYLDLSQSTRKADSLEAGGAVVEDKSTPRSSDAEDVVHEPVPPLLTYAEYLALIQSPRKENSLEADGAVLKDYCTPGSSKAEGDVLKPVPPLLTYTEYLDLIQSTKKENFLEVDGAEEEDDSTPGSSNAEDDIQEPVPQLLTYAEYLDLIQSPRKKNSLEADNAVVEDESMSRLSNAGNGVQEPVSPSSSYAEYLDLTQSTKKKNCLQADRAVVKDESTPPSSYAEDDVEERVPPLLTYAEYLNLIKTTTKENSLEVDGAAEEDDSTPESSNAENDVQEPVPRRLTYAAYLDLIQRTTKENSLQADNADVKDKSTDYLSCVDCALLGVSEQNYETFDESMVKLITYLHNFNITEQNDIEQTRVDEVVDEEEQYMPNLIGGAKCVYKEVFTDDEEMFIPELKSYPELLYEVSYVDEEENRIPELTGYSESSNQNSFIDEEEEVIPHLESYSKQVNQQNDPKNNEAHGYSPNITSTSGNLIQQDAKEESESLDKIKILKATRESSEIGSNSREDELLPARSRDQLDTTCVTSEEYISGFIKDNWLPGFTNQNSQTFDESMADLMTMLYQFHLDESNSHEGEVLLDRSSDQPDTTCVTSEECISGFIKDQHVLSSLDCWLPDFTNQNNQTFDESMVDLMTMLYHLELDERNNTKRKQTSQFFSEENTTEENQAQENFVQTGNTSVKDKLQGTYSTNNFDNKDSTSEESIPDLVTCSGLLEQQADDNTAEGKQGKLSLACSADYFNNKHDSSEETIAMLISSEDDTDENEVGESTAERRSCSKYFDRTNNSKGKESLQTGRIGSDIVRGTLPLACSKEYLDYRSNTSKKSVPKLSPACSTDFSEHNYVKNNVRQNQMNNNTLRRRSDEATTLNLEDNIKKELVSKQSLEKDDEPTSIADSQLEKFRSNLDSSCDEPIIDASCPSEGFENKQPFASSLPDSLTYSYNRNNMQENQKRGPESENSNEKLSLTRVVSPQPNESVGEEHEYMQMLELQQQEIKDLSKKFSNPFLLSSFDTASYAAHCQKPGTSGMRSSKFIKSSSIGGEIPTPSTSSEINPSSDAYEMSTSMEATESRTPIDITEGSSQFEDITVSSSTTAVAEQNSPNANTETKLKRGKNKNPLHGTRTVLSPINDNILPTSSSQQVLSRIEGNEIISPSTSKEIRIEKEQDVKQEIEQNEENEEQDLAINRSSSFSVKSKKLNTSFEDATSPKKHKRKKCASLPPSTKFSTFRGRHPTYFEQLKKEATPEKIPEEEKENYEKRCLRIRLEMLRRQLQSKDDESEDGEDDENIFLMEL